jgi:hypothetical protein
VEEIAVAEKVTAISFGMKKNDRRSFCRFSVFASFVGRDARELSVRFVV